MSINQMKRRQFLKSSTLGVVGAGVLGQQGLSASTQEEKKEAAPLKIKEYRTLGRTGFKASDISSGGPQEEGVINALLDAGVNYIDTAESYSRGMSETVTGKALKGRDRKKIFVTSKMVVNEKDTEESLLKRAYKCMERMQIDYLDCMMMHSAPRVASIKFAPFHAAMDKLKKQGKLRHVGISNHGPQWNDDVDSMEKVLMAAVADGRFDVFLLVYNFIQEGSGKRVLAACKEKNIGTTLMKVNPVGGYLGIKERAEQMKKEGKEIPAYFPRIIEKLKAKADQAMIYAEKNKLKNPAEIRDAAIKYVLKNPDVASVCISFVNFDQVDTYLKLSGSAITPAEEKKLAMFKQGCSELYCRHACGLCESHCPEGVPVNTILRYNHYFEAQGREHHAMRKYAALTTPRADRCAACSGHCEGACPFGVPAQGLLSLAHDRLILT